MIRIDLDVPHLYENIIISSYPRSQYQYIQAELVS